MRHQYHLSTDSEKVLSKYFDRTGSRTMNKIILNYGFIIDSEIQNILITFSNDEIKTIFDILKTFRSIKITNITSFDWFHDQISLKIYEKDECLTFKFRNEINTYVKFIAFLELHEQNKLKENNSDASETSGTSLIWD